MRMARGLHRESAMHMARAAALVVMATGVAMADAPARPGRKLSPYDSDPPNRITGQFGASAGLYLTLGGSLAYERRVDHDLGVLWRVGYANAASIVDKNNESDIGYAHVGIRYYGARAYFSVELGVATLRKRAYVERAGTDEEKAHPADYFTLPSVSVGFGGKPGGRLDIGLSALLPVFGVQVHFGWDFTQF